MLHAPIAMLCETPPGFGRTYSTSNDLVPFGSQCIYRLTPNIMMAEQKHCMLKF